MIISLRAGLPFQSSQETAIISIRSIVDGLHLRLPIAIRDMLDFLEPIKLVFELNAGTCSGSCEIVMMSNGLVNYTGKVHNSGALATSYVAITSLDISVATGGAIIIAHKGHVGGTFSFDTRNSTWDETVNDALIKENWIVTKKAATLAKTQFGTDTGALELIDGVVAGASGKFVFNL